MAKKSVATDDDKGEEEPFVLTIENVLKRKKPATDELKLLLDDGLQYKRREVVMEYNRKQAVSNARPDDEEAAKEAAVAATAMADIEAEIESMYVTFKYQALGRQELEDLQEQHLPSESQRKDWVAKKRKLDLPHNERLTYDPEGFPPAIMAACITEPRMTFDQAKEVWDSGQFSSGELEALWMTAWNVCKAMK